MIIKYRPYFEALENGAQPSILVPGYYWRTGMGPQASAGKVRESRGQVVEKRRFGP
jgi:hypothetical protein